MNIRFLQRWIANLSTCLIALGLITSSDAAIKPAKPRRGLDSVPPPAADIPTNANQAPTNKTYVPKPPEIEDISKPSAQILKDFAALEGIYAIPTKAREAITLCNNLRSGSSNYPVYFQKLQYFWAVALANSGDLDAATEKFKLASAPTTPDRTIAVRALNSQISFYIRDPDLVDRAVGLVKMAVARSAENSPGQFNARFQGACVLYILDEPAQAEAVLRVIETDLRKAEIGDPDIREIKKNTAYLLTAIQAAEAARNPQSSPHVFYAPWRSQEIRFGLGVNRRIADLAFNLRDFLRAEVLYQALEKEAALKGQNEIKAWCHMQRGRILFITGHPQESEELLSLFFSKSPFKDANCAPFALLRLGLLYHNCFKDAPKAVQIFETISQRFKNTPEAADAEYYCVMIPVLANKPKEALPLLIDYIRDHPDREESSYLTGHLIPSLQKQLTTATPAAPGSITSPH